MSRPSVARRIFTGALLASLGAGAVVLLGMLFLQEFTETRGRLLLTALASSGSSIVGLMAARLYEQGKGWLLPAAGILASLVGFTLIAIGLWATPDSDGYWKITAIASILTVSLAQVCWLRWWEWKSYPSHEPGKRARDTLARYSWYASVLMVSVLALLASSAIILEIRFGLFWRWVALFAIVNGLINLTVPVLTRITSPGYPDRSQSN